MHRTSDSEYIVSGDTQSYGPGGCNFLLIKLSPVGGLSWAKYYGGIDFDYGEFVQQTLDTGYIFVGTSRSYGAGLDDFLLIKLSSTGVVKWGKTFGGSSFDRARCVQQTSDSGYIVVGQTQSYGQGGNDFLILKLTSAGDLSWAKTFGGGNNDYAWRVCETLDSGYIVAGSSRRNYAPWDDDILLIKLNSTGDTLWAKIFGGVGNDWDYGFEKSLDTGYIFVGGSESYGAGSFDFLVASCSPETSSISLTGTDICPHGAEEKRFFAGAQNERLEIYPNPSRLGGTVIRFRIPELRSQRSEIRIQIYDLVGRVVKTFNHLTSRPFNQIVWDGRDENNRKVASGIYFCELQVDGSKRRKLIVLR